MVLVLMLVLLCLSGFFSSSETALFSLTRSDIHNLRAVPTRTAQLQVKLLEQPRKLLVAILFGNLAVNISFYALASGLSLKLVEAEGAGAAGAVGLCSLLVLIIFGEVVPKAAAMRFRHQVAAAASYPIWVLATIARPILVVLEVITRGVSSLVPLKGESVSVSAWELEMLVELSRSRGLIEDFESEMIQETLALPTVKVREVMTPRVEVAMHRLGDGWDALVSLIGRTKHTKVPVYEGTIDRIVGLVYAKDVLASSARDVRAILQQVDFVPETKSLESQLQIFRETGKQMAVVIDEYGGTSGLVTLEDVLEQIVGPIQDEYEAAEKEPVTKLGPTRYEVSGKLSIKDWNDLFVTQLVPAQCDTVGGFISIVLGHVPRVGEKVTYQNLQFTVSSMARHRIERILLEIDGGGEGRT